LEGHEIVLTADRSFMSDYHLLPFLRGLRFASTSVLSPSLFFRFVSPPIPKTESGKALLAPYHTRRTEAALINSGFNQNQVIVAAPENSVNFISSKTKIVSVTARDPLSRIHHYSLLNPLCKESYGSLSFKKLVRQLHSFRLSKKYRFKIVVDGPGAWQLANPEEMRRFHLDHIIVGEFTTNDIPHMFKSIINDADTPSVLHTTYTDIDETPLVRGGVTEGLVEVARGCNRRCRFCTVSSLRCRELKAVTAEVETNVSCGQHNVTLRSDDILNYGAAGVMVNRKAVLSLYQEVSKVNDAKRIGQCYLNLASAVSEPSLIKEISEIIGAGSKNYPYTTALVGIESGSPALIEAHMNGKARPFQSSEWPDVVEQGFGICTDNHWVPLGMLILGFPDETDRDICKTTSLVEKLSPYKSVLIPFVFDAKGVLKTEKSFSAKDLKSSHLDLIHAILDHNLRWVSRLVKEQMSSMSQWRWLFSMISPLIDLGIRKAHEKLLDEIVASAHTLT